MYIWFSVVKQLLVMRWPHYVVLFVFSPPALISDVTHLKKELDDLVEAIIENFFEPTKNKLQPKPE